MTLNFLQGQWWSTLYDLSNKTPKVTLEVTTHALEHWWEAGPLMRVRFTKVGKRQILWPCQLFSRRLFNQTCFFVNLVLDLTINLNINHMFEHRVQKKQIFYGTVHLHCTMTFDLGQGQCFYTWFERLEHT